MFSRTCFIHSVHSGSVSQHAIGPGSLHLPWRHPPHTHTHTHIHTHKHTPREVEMAIEVSGTHPTGMDSSYWVSVVVLI